MAVCLGRLDWSFDNGLVKHGNLAMKDQRLSNCQEALILMM